MNITEMTKEQKMAWLAGTSAGEFIRHYNSTLIRYREFKIDRDPEIIEDWELTLDEMMKRLAK